jgi:hypothetical protein
MPERTDGLPDPDQGILKSIVAVVGVLKIIGTNPVDPGLVSAIACLKNSSLFIFC